jgi:hypothetical protein
MPGIKMKSHTGNGLEFRLEKRAGSASLTQFNGVFVLAVNVHGQAAVGSVIAEIDRRHLQHNILTKKNEKKKKNKEETMRDNVTRK